MKAIVTDGPARSGDSGRRPDEETGADDCADSERDERPGSQCALQAFLTLAKALRHEAVD